MKTNLSKKNNETVRCRENETSSSCGTRCELVSHPTPGISRGKDLSILPKIVKKPKHRAGLSHRIDLYFEDVKKSMKTELSMTSSILRDLIDFKKSMTNDMVFMKKVLATMQADIKKVSCVYSSSSSSSNSSDDSEMEVSQNISKGISQK